MTHLHRTEVPFLPIVVMGACLLAAQPRSQDQKPAGLSERTQMLRVVEPDPGERELRTTPVVRAVQRTADSVVSIYLQSEHALAGRGPTTTTEGQGSGVILDESGLVITNWHVVAPLLMQAGQAQLDVEVKLRDGRARPATVLSTSATRDLALLQMRLEGEEKVKPAEIGRSADLMIGETMIAIGNPQGHANTVTSGVLSAIGRTIQVRTPDNKVRTYSDLLQTDAAINQGNSGGALLDITGKLVGINAAMAMGAENIGFAIPMDIVREVFERELVCSSSFAYAADAAWIGLDVCEKEGAVVVASVDPHSPAERAGILKGDVLAQVAGQSVRTTLDYQRQLVAAKALQPFAMALRRGEQSLHVAPVPTTPVHRDLLAAIGAEVEEIRADKDPDLVRKVTIAFYAETNMRRVAMLPSALRITAVQPDSPAADIGLQPGDLLLASIRLGMLGPEEQPLFAARTFLSQLQGQARTGLRIAILRGDTTLEGTVHVRRTPGR